MRKKKNENKKNFLQKLVFFNQELFKNKIISKDMKILTSKKRSLSRIRAQKKALLLEEKVKNNSTHLIWVLSFLQFLRKKTRIHTVAAEADAIIVAVEAAEGAVAEAVAEKDAERVVEKDAENGAMKDVENGAMKDVENGAAKDAENGAAKDAENGAAKDAEIGAAKDAEIGAENHAEKGAGSVVAGAADVDVVAPSKTLAVVKKIIKRKEEIGSRSSP